MNFKEFKKEKTSQLLELANDFTELKFEFSDSDTVQDTLKYFVKEKGLDARVIHKILQDCSIAFLTPDDDKEDIMDVGYVVGYINAKRPGRIFKIDFEKYNYFFIGVEADIIQKLKTELNKKIKI